MVGLSTALLCRSGFTEGVIVGAPGNGRSDAFFIPPWRSFCVMEVVLIRHGEPEWARDGFNVDDPPLTQRGREQAQRLADRLAGETFDEILVSPLRRARETAQPLLQHRQAAEAVEPWLEEIRNPIWQGTPVEKAQAAFRADRALSADHRWNGLPGGEPVRDFVDRIHRGMGGFLTARGLAPNRPDYPVWRIPEPGRRIAFIAHAGTNAVVICHLLGLTPVPWEWERFVLGHASISRLEALAVGDGFAFSLSRLSDVEHLTEDQRTR